jgi:predicted HicB family RNase H-like nuclease
MKDMMEYKGYYGSVHYNHNDRVFYGKVEFIRSLVSYEGDDVESLNAAFQEAVDDYLEICKETGKLPEKPFKGTFNVRTGPELHRKAAIYATQHDKTLNAVVAEALDTYLSKEKEFANH